MDYHYHKCQHLLAHTPAAKMLRLRGTHTALLPSFLHQEFKTGGWRRGPCWLRS